MLGRTLSLAALLVLLGADVASARTTVRVEAPTPVSAYGSDVVYSRNDPATRKFQLWYAHGRAAPIPLPIDERAVPFDADIGPGPDGHRVAVYSRCSSEPPYDTGDENAWPIPYTRGRGCSLYEVDLFTNVERRLPASGDEVLPTVWGATVAFARTHDGRPQLFVRTADGRERRLPGGPGSTAYPTALDLRHTRLAFGWTYIPVHRDTLGPASDLRVDDTRGGRGLVVDRFPGGGLTTITLTAPQYADGALYWARLCQGDSAGCSGRAGLMYARGLPGIAHGSAAKTCGRHASATSRSCSITRTSSSSAATAARCIRRSIRSTFAAARHWSDPRSRIASSGQRS